MNDGVPVFYLILLIYKNMTIQRRICRWQMTVYFPLYNRDIVLVEIFMLAGCKESGATWRPKMFCNCRITNMNIDHHRHHLTTHGSAVQGDSGPMATDDSVDVERVWGATKTDRRQQYEH